MKLKRLVATTLRSTGLSQRQLAERIGVSHGTVNNVLAGSPPRNLPTLQKFADYFHLTLDQIQDSTDRQHVAEDPATYLLQHSASQRIVKLLEQLDAEEIATIERCAHAFAKSKTDDVRQHLIGQLKIIERLVHHEQSTGPPSHKAKGTD